MQIYIVNLITVRNLCSVSDTIYTLLRGLGIIQGTIQFYYAILECLTYPFNLITPMLLACMRKAFRKPA